MTATADLLVKVKGDTSNAEGALGRMKGGLGAFGKAAIVAGGVAGVAIAGAATKGVLEFASFDKGMKEVFTLMPGISKDAMGAMQDDVLKLSKSMGVVPEEIIPALYDSISAGVPAESVFEFLETATKASIGGVTDLGTAVDGITSTINAFGKENISAEKASDLMFTAVRLGKTTMEELSGALFQVNPIAAGLGVEFGDVTAALAVLTSQGVPTKVAATQMKSALAELGKTGSVADQTFRELAGKGFSQFVKEGGNVQDALSMMRTKADESGIQITEFFGSIEAGQAAMALTSETGSKAFTTAMDEMGKSAGATETAFGTMDSGLARTWDKIKANVASAFIEIGAVLAPFIEQFLDWFMGVLPGAIAWFEDALATVGPILAEIGKWLGENIPAMIAVATEAFNAIAPIVTEVFNTIRGVIETVVGWFKGAGGVGGAEAGSKGIIDTFKKLWDTIKPIWEQIQTLIETVIETVQVVIGLALDGIMALWENHGERIMDTVTRVWQAIADIISGVIDVITGIFNVFKGIFTGDWDTFWTGIKQIFGGIWDAIGGIIRVAIDTVRLAIQLGLDLIQNIWTTTWNAIETFVGNIWSGITSSISGFVSSIWGKIVGTLTTIRSNLISEFSGMVASAAQKVGELPGKILDFLKQIPNKIISAIGGIVSAAGDLAGSLVNGIINGLGGLAEGLYRKLRDAISGAFTRVKNFFGIASPSRWTEDEIGSPLAAGIQRGLTGIDMSTMLRDVVPPRVSVEGAGGGGPTIQITVEGNLFGASTVDELAIMLRDRLGVERTNGLVMA